MIRTFLKAKAVKEVFPAFGDVGLELTSRVKSSSIKH